MFYIDDASDPNTIIVGWNGAWNVLEYAEFDFRDIIGLENWEPVAEIVFARLGFPASFGIERLKEALAAEAKIDAAIEELFKPEGIYPAFMDRVSPVPLADALAEIEKFRTQIATRTAKRRLTRERRQKFNGRQAELALKLIESGVPYACKAEGCGTAVDLTLDHIVPLSRGGSDDLSNLQFLCRSHNSQKGDRT